MTGRAWPRRLAAGIAGAALGAGAVAGAALLLWGGEGFLSSAGFLIAMTVLSTAAGVWVGAPDGPVPGHRRVMGRWMLAVGAMVVASFVASFWLGSPWLQTAALGPPLAVVLLLAEPAYAIGALLSALEARRRRWLAERWYALGPTGGRATGVAVPAMLGVAAGAALSAAWLIPAFPPGPVFLGLALLLTTAGSLEMGLAAEPEGEGMADRVVIVTGVGGRGQVGYAVAEAFHRRGARVVVTGRSQAVESRARDLGGDVVGVAADLATEEGADRVVGAARDRWGRLDVLVNVAGGLHGVRPVAQSSPEDWQRELDANVRTTFLMCRAALPLLRESAGAIVNFSSPAGLRAAKGMAAYSAAKAGVAALTRSLALEEKESGVRVNAIAPGVIDTAQNREAMGDADGGWVTREQVVSTVLFLSEAAGSGVNGETVRVLGSQL